jgi:hydroxymethylpyrimidine pyrophosphatase-like HAD family hydrolase
MGGLLLAVDYHWTLANERNGEFTVNADVLNAITNFINLGNSFAVVTSGATRHVKGLSALMGKVYLALENGLIVVKPSGERIINAPAQWWRLRDEVKAHLSVLGVRFSEGEVSLFTENSKAVIDALSSFDVKLEVNRNMLSIMPKGIDKGYAINVLSRLIKPSLVISIGDAENDIPMLRAADIPVAVGNALPEVKGIARYVTRGEDGQGVVELIGIILNCRGNVARCIDEARGS